MAKLNWDKCRYETQSKRQSLDVPVYNENVFSRGKYSGKRIDHIIHTDPSYCDWILSSDPNGYIAKQIICYCQLYPEVWES